MLDWYDPRRDADQYTLWRDGELTYGFHQLDRQLAQFENPALLVIATSKLVFRDSIVDGRWCMDVRHRSLVPSRTSHQAMRTETGLATRIMRLSTSLPSAISPCWFANMRARSRGPIRAL